MLINDANFCFDQMKKLIYKLYTKIRKNNFWIRQVEGQ